MRRPGDHKLVMVGPEVFNFTIQRIPALVKETLCRSRLEQSDIDWFVFHQANRFMMEHLRKKLGVPEENCVTFLETCGNTVSSTIRIALCETARSGNLRRGNTVMVVGFGVGYSWAACILRW